MAKPPVSEQVQVNFRMPVDLRDRMKRKAEADGVSLNALLIHALEDAFPPPRDVSHVLNDVAQLLMYVEPELREKAIAAIAQEAGSEKLSLLARAFADAERDMGYRLPWDE